MNKSKKVLYASTAVFSLILVAGFIFASPAFAQAPQGGHMGWQGAGNRQPGVFGTVASVSGTTLTVTSKMGPNSTATTYTVDASNATVTKSNAASSVSAIAVGDTVMIQGTVSGTNVTAKTIRDGVMTGPGRGFGGANGMGIGGTVSAINGTSLTVTGRGRPTGTPTTATPVTYTVDASNATVTKNNTASSVSAIAVGDTVMVQGTVSGTSVTAKTIRDGVVPTGNNASQNSIIQGNGQPVVAGNVTSVSGNTITITNKSNVTYTIDATNAKIAKGNVASTISSIANGDSIIAQGTVNGTSVTASSVIDQTKAAGSATNTSAKPQGGFMGGIVNFFKHIFGF